MKFILQTNSDGTHEFIAGETEDDAIAAYRAHRRPTVLFSAWFSITLKTPVVFRAFLIGPDAIDCNVYATELDGYLHWQRVAVIGDE